MNKQITTSKEIAQLELNKSVKSVNRQQWINTLRDCVSEYIASLETYRRKLENAKKCNDLISFKKNENLPYELRRLITKIELMLNPEEDKSKKLLLTLFTLSTLVLDDTLDFHSEGYQTENTNLLRQLIDITGSILKEEWNRVKKGE